MITTKRQRAIVVRARVIAAHPDRFSDDDRAWLETPEVKAALELAGPSVDAAVRFGVNEEEASAPRAFRFTGEPR